MNLSILRKFSIIIGLLAIWAPPGFGSAGNLTLDISPYYGNGRLSEAHRVVYSAGLSGAVGWQFHLTPRTSIVPRLEVLSAKLSAKSSENGRKSIATYSSSILAAGFRIVHSLSQAEMEPKFFLATSYGQGKSSLQIDESTPASYQDKSFDGIKGTYQAIELGAVWPLGENVAILAGLYGSRYRANQREVKGRLDQRESVPTGLALKEAKINKDESGLQNEATLTSYGAKIGVSLNL